MKDEVITIQFDGGSRGNLGPAGLGVVLRAADGTPVVTLGRFIGRATNNVAEYRALITGLQKAKELGAQRIVVRGDSELIIRQMRGEYRVKSPDMRPLYEQAKELFDEFQEARIEHNYRDKNTLADRLANLAMDKKADVTEDGDESSLETRTVPDSPKAGDQFECPKCRCVIKLVEPSGVRPHQLKLFACQCGTKMNPQA